MDAITLAAKPRTPGKGPARAARREEEVPCVLYGRDTEPVIFQVPERSLLPLIYTNEFHRVTVKVGRKSHDCVLKHVDFHPVSDRPMHADFQILTSGEVITLTVPIRYTGVSRGQRDGGRTQAFFHELEVTCLPKDIPDHIEVDISELEIGDTIHLSDVAVEGVIFGAGQDTLLYSVMAPRLEVEEEEEELVEGEGLEGEEGAEGEESEESSETED
jgi:large subunit ribosomal protein L25